MNLVDDFPIKVSVLIPLKNLSEAKERLGDVLSLRQRQELCMAMLADVLSAVRACTEVEDICLLTNDDYLAKQHNVGFLSDGGRELNDAVNNAVRNEKLLQRYDLLVLHADLPLLTSEDLNSLIEEHVELRAQVNQCMSLVSDVHNRGSNALLCTPPNAVKFAYGENSRSKHMQYAKKSQLKSQELTLPSIQRDIDTPEDLEFLKKKIQEDSRCAPHTAMLVSRW